MQYFKENTNDFLTQKSFPVLHRKDKVVMGVVDTVSSTGDSHTVTYYI
jgi:hypothetical protein